MSINCLGSAHGKNFSVYHGDTIEIMRQMPDNSVHMSVFSPPFMSLYTYSDSPRDLGNTSDDEFMDGYRFVARELFRLTKPGRECFVHCCDLPVFKYKDGRMGFKDFSGMLIKAHEEEGWEWAMPRVTVWKDPVTEMQRSKAHRLLHKTIKTDSARSGIGNPDYLLVFRKPGVNEEPVTHTNEDFPVSQWQEWASPVWKVDGSEVTDADRKFVWMDIDQTDTLNVKGSKDDQDERHVCPLQLDFIRRCIVLGSNKGDVVFSPFAGIGSEGYSAISNERRFVGNELKDAYFARMVANLREVDEPRQASMFDMFSGDKFQSTMFP